MNKNIETNLLIKQMNQSDAIAYRPGFLASPTDSEFAVLNRAYALIRRRKPANGF